MKNFKALQVSEPSEKRFVSDIVERRVDDLPEGEVLVQVQYSSLNYKDALSASGNKGVTREYPHTPGIDAAGIVVESASGTFDAGDEVVIMGYDLGMNTAGGFGQYIRVPASWVLTRPGGLSLRDSMILGTAGFTAALCIEKLIVNGITPDSGDMLVTGATGGVGIIAVMLLHKLGYKVVAGTGKESCHELLRELGADDILDRSELSGSDRRPLLKARWAGAVDVVGGDTLFNIIKSLNYGGSVAACGLVQSAMFQASVFPFILRGVNLLGVDSVELPRDTKQAVLNRLGGEWRLDKLESVCTEIGLEQLEASLTEVLRGEARGRFLLNLVPP